MNHTNKIEFKCGHCEFVCYSKGGLKKHRVRAHREQKTVELVGNDTDDNNSETSMVEFDCDDADVRRFESVEMQREEYSSTISNEQIIVTVATEENILTFTQL